MPIRGVLLGPGVLRVSACAKDHRLVYYDSYPDVPVAIGREKQLKHWQHEKKTALESGLWARPTCGPSPDAWRAFSISFFRPSRESTVPHCLRRSSPLVFELRTIEFAV